MRELSKAITKKKEEPCCAHPMPRDFMEETGIKICVECGKVEYGEKYHNDETERQREYNRLNYHKTKKLKTKKGKA